ncbi:MAG: hypothetical protein Q4G71_09790 [Pseudomonadota bacterium]|nr:hypothetical protein [Pseudomonadota bacterium]
MNKTSLTLAVAALLSTAAWAQTAGSPAAVGTDQQTANEAMRSAVPSDQVGTVVRTGETPAQALTPGSDTTTTTPGTAPPAAQPPASTQMPQTEPTRSPAPVTRPPRADRN